LSPRAYTRKLQKFESIKIGNQTLQLELTPGGNNVAKRKDLKILFLSSAICLVEIYRNPYNKEAKSFPFGQNRIFIAPITFFVTKRKNFFQF
jgi:hypothetical protein